MMVFKAGANWANRTLWTGDNLEIMLGMNAGSVDLIYLDPPHNQYKMFNMKSDSEMKEAPLNWVLKEGETVWLGELADRDQAVSSLAKTARETHSEKMRAYIIYMAVRLLEMKRILKDTGSIYLHCGPKTSHYLKLLMDAVFGNKQFRNEIVWCYSVPTNTRNQFPHSHDTILFYVKNDSVSGTFNRDAVRIPYPENTYTVKSGHSLERRKNLGDYFSTGREEQLARGRMVGDFWIDVSRIRSTQSIEHTGYPTQKPLALLDRIIRASSNKGEVVFDPFYGTATACVAAERLERQWVGIDVTESAIEIVQSRFKKELIPLNDIVHRTDIPKRTDLGERPNYRTEKHILFGRQDGICVGCQERLSFKNLTLDHIIPRSKRGTNDIENLQLLCGFCNNLKGNGTQEEFIAKLVERGYCT